MKHIKLFEQFVNEEKININKEIKRLKQMDYNAEKWDDGIIVRDHTAPNPDWDGTADYVWSPSDGIYCNDSKYAGDDQDYDTFLAILYWPTNYNDEWE